MSLNLQKERRGNADMDEVAALIRKHTRSGMNKTTQMALKDPSMTLEPEQVAVVKQGFRDRFGGATASQALRTIDQRLYNEKDITGAHVQSAELAAREMTSPLIGATRKLVGAKADKIKAQQDFTSATKREVETTEKRDQLAKDRERHAEVGFAPIGMSYEDMQDAQEAFDEAKADLVAATSALARATKAEKAAQGAVEACRKSLDVEYKPGEDVLALKKQVTDLRKYTAYLIQQQIDAQDEQREAEKELKERQEYLEKNRGEHSLSFQPGLTGPVETAQKNLTKADIKLAEAKERIADSMQDEDELLDRINALTTGPAYRDSQQLLDNLAKDPKLQELLAEMAPKGMGGKAVSAVKSGVQPKELGKLAVGFIPFGSAVVGGKEALDAEAEQERLGSASKAPNMTPVAKSITEVLERDAEKAKWKAMFKVTFGVIFSGLSMKGASAIGALMSPVTDAVGGLAGDAASSVLHNALADQLVVKVAEAIPSSAVSFTAKKLGTVAAEQSLPDPLNEERSKLMGQKDQLAGLELEEGTAFPSVPNPSDPGDPWSLSDPDTAKALLTFLGPGVDKQRLADPTTRDMEERRLAMREKMFGTKPDVDVTRGGKASDMERALKDELGSDKSGGGTHASQATPLQLVYAALGWRE